MPLILEEIESRFIDASVSIISRKTVSEILNTMYGKSISFKRKLSSKHVTPRIVWMHSLRRMAIVVADTLKLISIFYLFDT